MKLSRPATFIASSFLLALAACSSPSAVTPASASTPPATPMVAAAPVATPPAPVVIAPAPAVATVDFIKSVQPFFATYCYQCHGPTRQSSRIRFDDRSVVFARRGLITPGNPDRSSLISVLSAPAGSENHMPARGADKQPTAEEIAMIKDWIAQGANWPESATVAPSQSASAGPARGDDE